MKRLNGRHLSKTFLGSENIFLYGTFVRIYQ
jgi:hypothetical protein